MAGCGVAVNAGAEVGGLSESRVVEEADRASFDFAPVSYV
jgi:hypothetical protein